MSFVEDARQFLVGRVVFPATNYAMNRKGILGRYQKLLATEHLPQEILGQLQFQKLSAVLRYAYQNCPFYARRFKELRLIPGDIKSLEDFRQIPPLERHELIEQRLDLVDSRIRESAPAADRTGLDPGLPPPLARFRRHRLVRNTSTGSTGTPTVFYEDGSTTALNWVHEQRLKSWYGLAPGAKEARMKGVSTQHNPRNLLRAVRKHLWNQLMLPGFFLSDADYERSLRKIRSFRPRVLWGPTPGLAGLARYILYGKQDISQFSPSLVISWAAPLYDHERKLLQEVFGCPVSNIYSTREVGHVAMICPHGSLHVNQENYLVEIEQGDGDGVDRQTGQILVTPLNESPMPFIRYRIGDLAELGENPCPCGRTLITLKKILGRTGDVFHTEDGRMIEPNFWCLAFMSGRPSREVERFQVIYRRSDRICLRIVRRPGYSLETESELRQFLGKTFAPQMKFQFEYVPAIQPQPSGKYLFVVNEINETEERLVPSEIS
jgi:phenylacetate-CoA ligase